MKLAWNGDLLQVLYAVPGATVADLIQSLRSQWKIPGTYPRLALFDEDGAELDPADPVPADDREYILRPVVIH